MMVLQKWAQVDKLYNFSYAKKHLFIRIDAFFMPKIKNWRWFYDGIINNR